jgi:hypothetical protein
VIVRTPSRVITVRSRVCVAINAPIRSAVLVRPA